MVDEQDYTLNFNDPKHATTHDEPACNISNLEETNNPGLDTESIFGDSDCGEPLNAHHLRIDFTPNDDEDNEFAQEKCCKFWNFINSLPQIRNYMVYPEKHYAETKVTSLESSQSTVEENAADIGRTAVSMLELVQEKGFINRIFEAKMPQSSCTLGSREYKELEELTTKKKTNTCCFPPYICTCIQAPSIITKSLSPLKNMVKKMEDWDAKHPKSMDPPGHPPSLQHCILQRSYYENAP